MGQAASRQQEFWEACSYGREWLVKKMISEGIDVNWVSHIHDCCPIHVASQGDVGIVKLLIAASCDIEAVDFQKNTALHHAAMSGKAAVCEILLEAGANLNAMNHNGWTPLINACYWNHPIVVEIFLLKSADVQIRNKEGRKCIHEVCRCKCKTIEEELDLVVILDRLIEAGCSLLEKSETVNTWDCEVSTVDSITQADFTPLMFACYHQHAPLVERILQFETSNINDTDMNGWTALHWAAQRGHKEIVALLLQHGADIDSRGRHNETPADSTNDCTIQRMLTDPTAFPYPVIVSNGHVTTDDEDETEHVDDDDDDAEEEEEEEECENHENPTTTTITTTPVLNGCEEKDSQVAPRLRVDDL